MTTYKNVLIIHNPVAGKHDAKQVQQAISESLNKLGLTYTYRQTEGKGDATTWACEAVEANNCDIIISAGGDGTVMEVLRGIVGSKHIIPILIVSLGTANLLSRALDLPQDRDKVLELIMGGKLEGGQQGKEHYFDVGYIENKDRYFCLGIGAGLNADVVRDADREEKNRWGMLAYFVALARRVFDRRMHTIEISYDGTMERIRAHSVMILNASRFNLSGIHVGPAANPHDGLLETIVMDRVSTVGTLQTLGQMLRGGTAKPLELKTAKRITVSSKPPLPVQADGESIGKTPIDVVVLESAVTFIVPKDYPTSRLLN